MTYSLTWLPEVLEQAGLKVAETPGWRTRGRGPMGTVRGVICHHTATRAKGNMPALGLLVNGRSDLAGPLAQLGLGRDGTFYVVAAGRANHAGMGQWEGLTTGNSSFIGIEAENDGVGEAWPPAQIDAYHRGVAAILRKIGARANMCCGHKEYAPKRKTDPSFDMPPFRSAVAALLQGKSPPPPIAARDDRERSTLRRGMRGDAVARAQQLMKVDADGIFGAKTEAVLRAYQRTHDLVPDGIVGPATWRVLEPAGPAVAASVTPAAVAPSGARPSSDTRKPASTAAGAAPAAVPAADDQSHAPRVKGRLAYDLRDKAFASLSRSGFYTRGETSFATWLESLPEQPDVSSSVVRVVKAMCVNEGRFEAINSYDSCHLSFGILQWTAGLADQPGELPVLIEALKRTDASAFADCFGRFGLDVAVNGATGLIVLDGKELRSGADKQVLREVLWAYRFWRAGHHPALRATQFALAAHRIQSFKSRNVGGNPLSAWMSSELGIALLLDEHVNRPGDVPGTLQKAIAKRYGGAPPDPATLNDAEEQDLIEAYLDARSKTSMTDSDGRATRIIESVGRGELSDRRNSFA